MSTPLRIKFPGAVQSIAIDDSQWEVLMTKGVTQKINFEVVDDRRSEPRREISKVMQMFVGLGQRDPQRFMVRTKNISSHGVGFVHSRPVRRGMQCSLAILTRDDKLVHFKATIASSKIRLDGHFDVGVSFEQPIALADFLIDEVKTRVS